MTKTLLTDLGGYPGNWPVGSIFANEGERLYQLVRKYKPTTIIEVGTRWGCSTAYLAMGCRDNKKGRVISYDIENLHHEWPADLAKFIDFRHRSYADNTPLECDLLFEDGAHTYGFTSQVLKTIQAKVVAVHDYKHWDCQVTVHDEADEAMGRPADEVFFQPPSDCGLGIWIQKK